MRAGFRSWGLALFASLAWTHCAAADTVEIVLRDRLDEPRGYCLDVPGYQQRAMPERGLHAHTCYAYQGGIAVDQGFDAGAIAAGRLRIVVFDVCAAAESLVEGARLSLVRCADVPAQAFVLHYDGRITPDRAQEWCATVAGGASRPGGGGRPPHRLRALSLQRCGEDTAVYQRWRLRSGHD